MKKKKLYKGGFEPIIARQLTRSKTKYQYETTSFPYTWTGSYTPDFTVTSKSGKVFYVEVKGHLRKEDRRKLRAVKKSNPALDLRICFQRDNRLDSKAKMTYTQWAEKAGIPWCIGSIPKKWLDE